MYDVFQFFNQLIENIPDQFFHLNSKIDGKYDFL